MDISIGVKSILLLYSRSLSNSLNGIHYINHSLPRIKETCLFRQKKTKDKLMRRENWCRKNKIKDIFKDPFYVNYYSSRLTTMTFFEKETKVQTLERNEESKLIPTTKKTEKTKGRRE